MRASACCSRAVCRPSEKCLDDSNIGPTLEQMGGKGVAKRMQRHALLDPGSIGSLVEQPVELAGGHRHAGFAPRKQPAFLKGCVCIETSARLPLPQQINDSMTLRSLRPLDCSIRMIFCARSRH